MEDNQLEEDLSQTLQERGNRYGPFGDHAQVTQDIKKIVHDSLRDNAQFDDLSWADKVVILESLDMIVHKIGRIVNGDALYADSWHDIAGYARLAETHINSIPPF